MPAGGATTLSWSTSGSRRCSCSCRSNHRSQSEASHLISRVGFCSAALPSGQLTQPPACCPLISASCRRPPNRSLTKARTKIAKTGTGMTPSALGGDPSTPPRSARPFLAGAPASPTAGSTMSGKTRTTLPTLAARRHRLGVSGTAMQTGRGGGVTARRFGRTKQQGRQLRGRATLPLAGGAGPTSFPSCSRDPQSHQSALRVRSVVTYVSARAVRPPCPGSALWTRRGPPASAR